MQKKDIRMQEPLYNSALFVLFIVEISGLAYTFRYFDIEMQNRITLGLEKLNIIPFIIAIVCLILSIILCVIYVLKIKKHNLENPTKKMKAFTAFTLNEFNDDDEFFSKATNAATRKGYLFFVNALGILLVLLLFQFPHYVYMIIILGIFIIQNLLYYSHMKKYYQ